MCICAYYQRLAPRLRLKTVLKGKEAFQELWLFLRLLLGYSQCLGSAVPCFKGRVIFIVGFCHGYSKFMLML